MYISKHVYTSKYVYTVYKYIYVYMYVYKQASKRVCVCVFTRSIRTYVRTYIQKYTACVILSGKGVSQGKTNPSTTRTVFKALNLAYCSCWLRIRLNPCRWSHLAHPLRLEPKKVRPPLNERQKHFSPVRIDSTSNAQRHAQYKWLNTKQCV